MFANTSELIKEIVSIVDNPSNEMDIKIVKYNDNVSNIIIHFDANSFPIKITTDFDKYCLCESPIDIIQVNKFNMKMCFKKKTPQNIINQIYDILPNENKNMKISFTDPYHVYQKIDDFSKFPIDYVKLEKAFESHIEHSKGTVINNKIPKELLLTPTQISQLVINEIKKVNRNKTFPHYIVPDFTNPYVLHMRFKFSLESDIGKIFNQINGNFGYDYMEIKLTVEPKTHPYMPPKLEYVKPKIKLPLLLTLINLDVLKLENWSPTITLEYFIINLGNQISDIGSNFIIGDAQSNANDSISYDELEYQLIKLVSITKENLPEKINVNIPIPKKTSQQSSNDKYWKAGTGYGSDSLKEWDIKSYIKEQELQKNDLAIILNNINRLITQENISTIYESVLIQYIYNQINGFNMLEFNKSRQLFMCIFNILSNLMCIGMSQTQINKISNELKSTLDELDILFKTSPESINDEDLLHVYCVIDLYVSKYQEQIKEIVISTNNKESYVQKMQQLQFGNYEIPLSHRFYKNKDIKPCQTAIMRILSEISTFKKGLPVNWESTIWTRVSKSSICVFSFLISGPKDTPYENGLFEFHAHFPSDYPNSVPAVLLHTTGNGKVRFNPNLYDSGKVCLSILGTWSGQEGEKWNAKTSTFLQVMVSIQSLILVEQPYFNEPGWEREMNTEKGKKASRSYNEERHGSTIKFAMTEMIKNPPAGFEEVVHNHFKMKKDEIINKTLIWEQNAEKYKQTIETNRNELVDLLVKL